MFTTSAQNLESRLVAQIHYIEQNYPGKNQLYLNLLKDSLKEINRLQKKVQIQSNVIKGTEICLKGTNKALETVLTNLIST